MKIAVTLSSKLPGPVQFQSETEQSFLYDFHFLFIYSLLVYF